MRLDQILLALLANLALSRAKNESSSQLDDPNRICDYKNDL